MPQPSSQLFVKYRLAILIVAILTCTGALVSVADGQVGSARRSLRPSAARLGSGTLIRSARAQTAATKPLIPSELHSGYALPDRGAPGQTIAILGAYDDPAVESDLRAYDKTYRLPACTTANGCFRKVNQSGKSSPLPTQDPTGGQFTIESALGVEVAHATCQSCKIVLIEANSDYGGDIASAARSAAASGATVAVTSIVDSEQFFDTQWQSSFSARKTAFVAASGDAQDSSYGFTGAVNFPSAFPNVLAVGGTQLTLANGAYRGEQAWKGTVSGCSSFSQAAAWQLAAAKLNQCGTARPVADLSADAEPGVIAHITGSGLSGGPWFDVSGTSVAAPIIAGVIGLAGSLGSDESQTLYQRAQTEPGTLHDITSGASSPDCGSPACRGQRGYDGPTGIGSPFGLGAFLRNGGALAAGKARLTAALLGHPTVPGSWTVRLRLRNGNAFAVSGTVGLQRSLASGHGLRRVIFAAAKRFTIAPLGTATVRLVVSASERQLLAKLGTVSVYAAGRTRGAAGRTISFAAPAGALARH